MYQQWLQNFIFCYLRSELSKSHTPLENYISAKTHCKRGCICSKENGYFITNDIWERNLCILRETRKDYSTKEKDTILKAALYNKLKELDFKTEKEHAKLKFNLRFVTDDEGRSKTFTLCEKCYVTFNEHISKLSYNLFIILFSDLFVYS